MLAPQTDAYSPVLKIGTPPAERWAFVAATIASAMAGALTLTYGRHLPGGIALPLSIAFWLAAIACLYLVARNERIEIDLGELTYRRSLGVTPLVRHQNVDLAGPLKVVYCEQRRLAAVDGQPEISCSAWISSENSIAPLVRWWNNNQAQEYLTLVAERLGASVALGDKGDLLGRRAIGSGAIMSWAGIALVISIMFWPILSGKRPFRPVWASSRIGRTDSGYESSFNQATRFLDERNFAYAEIAIKDALARGLDPADGHNTLAYALAGQNKLDMAMQAARIALSYRPGSGMILDTVGEMHELRKEYTDAVDYYKRALRRPDLTPDVETRAKLGRTLLALHRRTEALGHLRYAAQFPNQKYGKVAMDLLKSLGVVVPKPNASGGFTKAGSRNPSRLRAQRSRASVD